MSMLIVLSMFQAAATPATTPPAAPPEDAKITCRSITVTGSRLDTKRVCMSKKEWRRMQDESRATAEDYQNGQSKQPGNQ